jgi:alanine racemase
MFETLFGKEDRQLELRTNFKYNINMTDDHLGEDYYRVTTSIEYTKTFRNYIFTIGCALNRKQLSDLFEDGRCEYRWLLDGGEDTFRKNDFKVDRVRIDGEDVSIIRTEKTERGYEVLCGGDNLKEKLNKPVRMEIEIITKKPKGDNILPVYLVYPTRGLEILFNYSGTGLKNVREASFFAGKHPYPKVVKKEGGSLKLKTGDGEWIFPNSGVMFIWEEKAPKVAEG